MFGTKMTDEFFGVHTGGDVAFLNGVLKVLLAIGGIDREFVTEHTAGFDGLLDQLEDESFDRARATRRARPAPTWRASRTCTRTRSRAVLVWSMGITQHVDRRRQRARRS